MPNCNGKTCGDNGCGGSCGLCRGQNLCFNNQCVCQPQCGGKQCGSDGCGGQCGAGCLPGYACQGTTCVCVPNCNGKTCGDNGCGGSCGLCSGQNLCINNQCVCQPQCGGKQCGDNGCSGSCGSCTGQDLCIGTQCVCQPNCNGKQCGDNGCGGQCGGCDPLYSCGGTTCQLQATRPIYRAWRPGFDHMALLVPAPPLDYISEGTSYELFTQTGPGLIPLWQVYCGECADFMVTNVEFEGYPMYSNPELLGYCSEQPQPGATRPVYRLYFGGAYTDHFSTVDLLEVQNSGYAYEGILCYVP